MTDGYFLIFAAVVGLCFGSFANVVTNRLVKDQPVSWPPSYCFSCKTRLKWRDMVPIVSYVALRAACRYCKGTISRRYPLVEGICAVLFVFMARHTGVTFAVLPLWGLAFVLLCVSVVDWDTMEIPDGLLVFGAVCGAAWVALSYYCGLSYGGLSHGPGCGLSSYGLSYGPGYEPGCGLSYGSGYGPSHGPGYGTSHGLSCGPNYGPSSHGPSHGPGYAPSHGPNYGSSWWSSWRPALLGAAAGALPLFLVDRLVWMVAKKPGFGFGDVKLMAVCGLFLGVARVPAAYFFAFVCGGAFAAMLLVSGRAKRGSYFAFGPFLCFGVLVAFFLC